MRAVCQVIAGAFALLALIGPAAANYEAGASAFKRGDYIQAEREWNAAALRGDAQAQYQLGVMLLHGRRVSRDAERAQILFQDAASRGSVAAWFALYVMAASSDRVQTSEVARILEAAAEKGSRRAAIRLKSSREHITRPGAADPSKEEDYFPPYATALADRSVRLSDAVRLLEEGAMKGDRAAMLRLDLVRRLQLTESVGALTEDQERWTPISLEPVGLDTRARGLATYQRSCALCHDSGAAGAPRRLDRASWQSLGNKGLDALTSNAIRGIGAHPPNGVVYDLPHSEIRNAVYYLLND